MPRVAIANSILFIKSTFFKSEMKLAKSPCCKLEENVVANDLKEFVKTASTGMQILPIIALDS